jgi:hypothetical protein
VFRRRRKENPRSILFTIQGFDPSAFSLPINNPAPIIYDIGKKVLNA